MPEGEALATHFFAALERTAKRYKQTGHKMVLGNFANPLMGLVAPGARLRSKWRLQTST